MQRTFLTTLWATAIGFSHLTAAWSQSAPATPAANVTNAPHFLKAGFNALAKTKKSKIRRGVIEDPKKDDSWYKQMPDPCQVEG
jgi:hypothetical protein